MVYFSTFEWVVITKKRNGDSMRIAVGGLEKHKILQAVEANANDSVEVYVTTDIGAARDIKENKTDFYFGACNSGGGAAISILIGIVGYSKCCTVAKNGQKAKESEVIKYLEDGKICFGMAVENIDDTVALLMKNILKLR